MDQAALQRVTLARSSGTLCWTAWGAREQQSLRTLIGFCFCGSEAILLAHSLGEWCSSEFPGWPIISAMLQCTAGTLLRRRHSGSTWTVLQLFFSLAPRDTACIYDEFTATAGMSLRTTMRCWSCLIVPWTFSPPAWHGGDVHPETQSMFMTCDGWSLTWSCVTTLSLLLGIATIASPTGWTWETIHGIASNSCHSRTTYSCWKSTDG